MSICRASRRAWFSALALALVGGCEADDGRLPVFGTVHDARGQPLTGSMTFLPGEGRGLAATVAVVDGKYRFERAAGPESGPYRVVFRPSAEKKLEGPGVKPLRGPPAERSTATVVPDEPPYECNLRFE